MPQIIIAQNIVDIDRNRLGKPGQYYSDGRGNFYWAQVNGTLLPLPKEVIDLLAAEQAALIPIPEIPTTLPPSGAAGGDLSGSYPNPTVAKILGNAVPANTAGALTNDGSGVLTWTPAAGAPFYQTMEDEGVALPQRTNMNFVGAGVTVTDAGGKTIVTIPAGGGGTTTNPLTIGTGLTGTSFDGSAPVTIAIDSSVVTLTGAQALSNKTGNISQWTNDSGYLTDTVLAAGRIGFGSAGNALTGSASLTWDDTAKDLNVTGTISQVLTNTNNVWYVAQGNVGYWLTGAASTGLLAHQGFGIDMKTTEKYTMGAVGLANNNFIEVNDSASTVKISTLAGTGTQMVTADINGFLSKQAIPTALTPIGTALTSGQIFVGSSGNVVAALAMSGDATLVNTGALTLASVIVAGGATGSATVTPIITWDAKGRLTVVSSATITPAVGSITGLGTGVGTALAVNVGSAGAPVLFNGALGTPTSGTLTSATGLPVATGISGLGTNVASYLAQYQQRLFLTAGDQNNGSGAGNNAAANITELVTSTLTASKRYAFWGVISMGCNNTGGNKLAIVIPSGTVSFFINARTSGPTSPLIQSVVASATLNATAFNTQATSPIQVLVSGEVSLGVTGGTIQFQFASGTATQTSTVFQLGTLIQVIQLN